MAGPYRSCEVTLDFADADYLFKLPVKRIAELEEKCGAPVGTIWKRVCLTADYKVVDLLETVRLGLIGGGLDPQEARKLIDRYCDAWPLQIWHQHAIAILGVCVEGYADAESERPKDQAAGEIPTSTSPPPTPSDLKKESPHETSAS